MIKVLIVNNNLVLQSGITTVIKNLIENTIPNTIAYTIVTGSDPRNNNVYFENLGVKVVTMPKLSFFGFTRFISFFKRFFSENRFDIVHSHFSQIENIIFPMARKYGVKKCISHSHSAKLSESSWKATIYKIMCSGLTKRADYCAACSEQAGIALFGRSFPRLKNKIIIKNGIECQKYAFDEAARIELRKEYGLSDGCIVIGHVGRFSTGKNQAFLLKILKELNKRRKEYILFMVGEGVTKDHIEELVSELGLKDNVVMTGGKDNVSYYLNVFDVFVMPSIHEGLGIAAIEAQANGLECVLSTAIPREADLTGVKYLDLSEPVEIWANILESLPKNRHKDYNKRVVESGYDIHTVGIELTKFYISLIENE